MRHSLDTLSVGLDSWIIQDGNYGDLAVGDIAKFALEFAGDRLRPSAQRETRARHLGHGAYEVCARVPFVNAQAWVIDFGFCAFRESTPPEFASPGAWVEGEVLVGIDPFFYKESLRKLTGVPDLFYRWRIKSIERNDTPWLVEVNARGGKTLARDEAQEVWNNVARTDAWNDDDGRSSYVLNLERHDEASQRRHSADFSERIEAVALGFATRRGSDVQHGEDERQVVDRSGGRILVGIRLAGLLQQLHGWRLDVGDASLARHIYRSSR